MLRPLRVRLHPETAAWGAGFALLEVGIASSLKFFGVGGGLTVAWMLVAAGIFAACEPGFCAWVWVMIASNDEEEPPKKSDTDGAVGNAGEGAENEPSSKKDDLSPSPSMKPDFDPAASYEEKISHLINSRSSNLVRAIEVSLAVALAILAHFGSSWTPNKMQPPDQAALQRSIDQLRDDFKNCAQKICGNSAGNDNSRGGGFSDGDITHLDPKLRQELVDAFKEAADSAPTSWTNSSFFGVSILVLLMIGVALGIVVAIRKRPETAAPLGAVGLAAGAIKEAEHLSRLDTTSFRIAEVVFGLLLCALVWLAWKKIDQPDHLPAHPPAGDEQGKSKVESPLSLLFSSLVLLWALLVICYRQEPPPKPSSSGVSAVHQTISLPPLLLDSIYGFQPGKAELPPGESLNKVAQTMMQQASANGAQADDVLLLLGSADCTAIRKPGELTNNRLALQRADGLRQIVEGMKVFADKHVIARSLYQSEKCTSSDNLRAVFPVLIKMVKTE